VDTLIAGSGADVLQGHAGDTYELDAGFGNSQIETGSGTSTLQFGSGIAASDLTLGLTQGSDGNAALLIQDGSGATTVDGGLTGSIGQFKFADGSQLSLAQLLAVAQVNSSTIAGANGFAAFDATPGATLNGDIGNDTLIGGGDHDTLVAGTGNEQLYGIGKGDLLVASTGDDTLYGGSGATTLVGGSGNTVMYGGTGSDSYRLTQGGTATIYASSSPGVEGIYLPSGMTFSDFAPYRGSGGDLILQSLAGDTSVVIKGYYNSNTAQKTWILLDDTESPQFLGAFANSQQSPPSGYRQEIDGLRQAYAAGLPSTLNDLGQKGGSFEEPTTTIAPGDPTYDYHFQGTTGQNVTVQGGALHLGPSETDQKSFTTTTQETTETYQVPVYQTIDHPAHTVFIPVSQGQSADTSGDPTDQSSYLFAPVDDAAGNLVGYNLQVPDQQETTQTGTRTVTRTVQTQTTITHDTRQFTNYNVTGDGGDDVITVDAPFVGTVNTLGGDVYVDLGGNSGFYNTNDTYGHASYHGTLPGAFIEAGDGTDTLIGTGGQDTIAAGYGFDQLTGWLGSTFYVPMTAGATDVINVFGAPYYGNGPFPHNTLVLPDGITPADLQYKLILDPPNTVYQGDVQQWQAIQLTHGDSTVLVYFDAGPPSWNASKIASDDTDGINRFQFSDGTVLTRAQVLALAGPAVSASTYNPVVTVQDSSVAAGASVAAATLFAASDTSGSPARLYQISNAAGAGYFTLGNQIEPIGRTFYVTQDQLSQLAYVGGTAGTVDSVSVAAFDGLVWSTPASFQIQVPESGGVFQATGPDQEVDGSYVGPDTLIGGYGGDTLIGQSGEDTFVYNVGGGAESILETVLPVSTSVQFGSGISPSSITLGMADGELVLQLGSGDSVSIEGFDPMYPLNSTGIQSFDFQDGTSLSLAQLLSDPQVTGGSGSLTNADGSVTRYTFSPSSDQVYLAQAISADGQLTEQFTVASDGSTTDYLYNAQGQLTNAYLTGADGSANDSTYTYNGDGSYSDTVDSTSAGGSSTTTVYSYDAQGHLLSEGVQNADGSTANYTYNVQGQLTSADQTGADGSTSDSTYAYNADGSYSDTVVSTPAAGSATTTVYGYDAQGHLLSDGVHNPDGSTASYTYNVLGQLTSADQTAADGSVSDSTYAYNADGSYSDTVVSTPAGGSSTTSVYGYDAQGHLLSEGVHNPDGSTADYTYNVQGQLTSADVTGADGSANDSTYAYNADGSYSDTVVTTPAGGASTTTVYGYDAQGHLRGENIHSPDGSTAAYTYNVQGRLTSAYVTAADGATNDSTYAYNADGSYSDTVVVTPAGGGTTTTVYDYDAQGHLLSGDIGNPDGSKADYTYNGQGQLTSADIIGPDGSTNDSTYAYNADGSYTDTVVGTPAGGASTTTVYGYNAQGHLISESVRNPDGSTADYTFNPQGQLTSANSTGADGSTNDSTYAYHVDGSYTDTVVGTPAGGGSTTTVYGYDAQGHLLSDAVRNPDGSTADYTFNPQGQLTNADTTASDGSTNDSTYVYNADGSYTDTVVATPAASAATTTVYGYDAQGHLVSDNTYVPAADGSYTDSWFNQDASHGSYWWNSSTREYQENWYNSDGTHWTDDYQYAAGGSPGSTGYSFTESYTASDGSQGTRQFDASSGVTSLSWDSALSGPLSGTTADAGFIGLQNDGELTNTQPDPTYFNPTVSPGFNAFLTAHG
jgi:YD repeat-containing protein